MTVEKSSKGGWKNFLHFWSKNSKMAKSRSKMPKNEHFREKKKSTKNFIFQNWFRIFQNVFLTIKVDFENFLPLKIFLWESTVFDENGQKSEKFSGQKITKMSFRRVPQRALKRPIFKIFWPSLRSGRLRRYCRYVSSATGRRGITLTSKEDAGKPIPPSSSPEVDQGRASPRILCLGGRQRPLTF